MQIFISICHHHRTTLGTSFKAHLPNLPPAPTWDLPCDPGCYSATATCTPWATPPAHCLSLLLPLGAETQPSRATCALPPGTGTPPPPSQGGCWGPRAAGRHSHRLWRRKARVTSWARSLHPPQELTLPASNRPVRSTCQGRSSGAPAEDSPGSSTMRTIHTDNKRRYFMTARVYSGMQGWFHV